MRVVDNKRVEKGAILEYQSIEGQGARFMIGDKRDYPHYECIREGCLTPAHNLVLIYKPSDKKWPVSEVGDTYYSIPDDELVNPHIFKRVYDNSV
jgi:hypothetical protein